MMFKVNELIEVLEKLRDEALERGVENPEVWCQDMDSGSYKWIDNMPGTTTTTIWNEVQNWHPVFVKKGDGDPFDDPNPYNKMDENQIILPIAN